MRQSETQAAVSRSSAPRNWRFSDVEKTWAVVLGQDFISLETRQYPNFNRFLERLSFVLNALIKHIGPDVGLRIGLRYIDEIRTPNGDPRRSIRSELLGAMAQEEVFSNAVRSVQGLALTYLIEKRGTCSTRVLLLRDDGPADLLPGTHAAGPLTCSTPMSSENSCRQTHCIWTCRASASTWKSTIRPSTACLDGRWQTSTWIR